MSAAAEVYPIERDRVFGCELWRGELSGDGYGRIKGRGAHRVLWEREHGQVPDGQVLDHLCRRRACVADQHLEPVTPRENELRKSFSYRIKRKRCPRGHDLALTKIVTPEGPRPGEGGGVVCRQCNRDAFARDAYSGIDRTTSELRLAGVALTKEPHADRGAPTDGTEAVHEGSRDQARGADRVPRVAGGAPRDRGED